MDESPDEHESEMPFHDLCLNIGLALVTWQRVEEAHYKIFRRMLGTPPHDVTSSAYYSTESFEGRRKMVNAMAAYFLKGRGWKNQRAEWQDLEKLLKDGNETRNKLAHYQADYEIKKIEELPNGSVRFELIPQRLRPARLNYVSRLQGKTADKPAHNLGPNEIKKYIAEMDDLTDRLELFHVSIGQRPTEAPRTNSRAESGVETLM